MLHRNDMHETEAPKAGCWPGMLEGVWVQYQNDRGEAGVGMLLQNVTFNGEIRIAKKGESADIVTSDPLIGKGGLTTKGAYKLSTATGGYWVLNVIAEPTKEPEERRQPNLLTITERVAMSDLFKRGGGLPALLTKIPRLAIRDLFKTKNKKAISADPRDAWKVLEGDQIAEQLLRDRGYKKVAMPDPPMEPEKAIRQLIQRQKNQN